MKKKLQALLCLALVGLLTIQPITAWSGTLNYKYKLVCTVPDSGSHSGRAYVNMGSMCIVGSTLYCIKTNVIETSTQLIVIKNFTNSKKCTRKYIPIKTSSGSIKSLGHANGLTYYNGSLYIAGMQPAGSGTQVYRISTGGKITAEYKFDARVTAITYYKDNQFIIRTTAAYEDKKDDLKVKELEKATGQSIHPTYSTHTRFAVVKLSGDELIRTNVFYVSKENQLDTAQDIHYEAGYLYLPTVQSSTYKKNHIAKVAIPGNIISGSTYSPETIMVTTHGKNFEIESLDIVGSTIYCCTNHPPDKSGKSPYQDGIYKLYR